MTDLEKIDSGCSIPKVLSCSMQPRIEEVETDVKAILTNHLPHLSADVKQFFTMLDERTQMFVERAQTNRAAIQELGTEVNSIKEKIAGCDSAIQSVAANFKATMDILKWAIPTSVAVIGLVWGIVQFIISHI